MVICTLHEGGVAPAVLMGRVGLCTLGLFHLLKLLRLFRPVLLDVGRPCNSPQIDPAQEIAFP